MRKLFLLVSLLLFMIHGANGQIDESISTPPDLQHKDIKIVSKQKLPDGTIEIRYVNEKGRMIKRRTLAATPGSAPKMEEWDETNDADRKQTPKDAVGAAPLSGSDEVKAGGAGGESQKPAEGSTGDNEKARQQGGSGLKGAGEGAKSVGKETAPATAKEDPPKATVPAPDRAAKDQPGIGAESPDRPQAKVNATAKGTGNTIGIIANITVTNQNDFPVAIQPQTFFIPSDGKYQSYVGRIPPGITVPPKGTVDVPVNGVCADVHTPPVPNDTDMPPTETWVPVDVSPPPGAGDPPSTGPGPGNPPGGGTTPDVVTMVPVITTETVPEFNPTDIPHITTTSGFNPGDTPESDIIITWTGTDIPVGGTLDPVTDPKVFAPVIVSMLEAIEDAAEIVRQSGIFPTPFTRDSLKEENALIQQTFWIASAALTGKEYTKVDFTKNTYDQFQNTTGKTVASLPDEQKKQVDSGITDFWNTFQVTGVVAKVISAESPGIDVEIPNSLIQAAEVNVADHDNDDVADPEGAGEEEEGFNCVCPDTINYTITVKNGKDSWLRFERKSTDEIFEQEIKVEKLKFGDTLSVHAFDVEVDCHCAMTSCDVTWQLYFDLSESNNCYLWDNEPAVNGIWIKTKAINKKDKSIVGYFTIIVQCTAQGCNNCLCERHIKLTFVDSKSKK
jgi:hypothetical protein